MDAVVNNLNTPEISLRRAIALSSKSSGADFANNIKQSAFGQLDLISQAQGLVGGLQDNSDLQKQAIGLAVQGLEIAYHLISSQMQETAFQRKQFVDECSNYVATFTVNKDKEEEEFYKEEVAIQNYWELVQRECRSFESFFGIQAQVNPDNPKITRLSVMPYFRMSQSLPQKSLIASNLDQHQYAIFLFLKTGLPNAKYFQYYKDTYRVYLKLESFWTGRNYLNRFRAPLFIINSIANLLWNLQHPVDTNTGIPLTLAESINLCVKSELFLNNILDDYESSLLSQIDQPVNQIKSYLLQVELYIKSLRSAFEYEFLHEINIQDVSNSMHRAIRIMANKIFELIYKSSSASEDLMGQLMYLAELIMSNPSIMTKAFPEEFPHKVRHLNPVPCTLMDILILYCHHKPSRRQKVLTNLKLSKKDNLSELARVLSVIDTQYLTPFEHIALKPQHIKQATTTSTQIEVAKQFVPLLAMLMSCFTTFQDTRPQNMQEDILIVSDKKQREAILDDASSTNDDKYYQWSLSIFLKHKSGSSLSRLDSLLVDQNRMLGMTQLLDEMGTIILENRILLQLKEFQKMILGCLKKILQAYKELNTRLNHVEEAMNKDDMIQRNEKRILQPMLDDLEDTLDIIQKSISQVSVAISAPGFSEQQKKAMLEKTNGIQNLFEQTFHEKIRFDVALPLLAQTKETDSKASEESNARLQHPAIEEQTYKVAPLIQLVQKCYEGLSYSSRYHAKGKSLINLMYTLNSKQKLNIDEVEYFLLELLHLTSSPRSTYFFQAAYGETRSANILIDHILQSEFNQKCPIAQILFNNPNIKTEHLSKAIVVQKIVNLKKAYQWEDVAKEQIMTFN
jgi:hypothetical protein